MPKSASPPAPPSSGIHITMEGDRHIPQSLRADGSVRKEIKIRPGYRPPEDVEVYKNRTAEAWKNRGSGGVPGADEQWSSSAPAGPGKGKNAKRRESRKKAKTGEADPDNEADEDATKDADGEHFEKRGSKSVKSGDMRAPTQSNPTSKEQDAPTTLHGDQLDPDADKEKQARNLRKRLRQARELKEKEASGGSLLPEQFAKVIKINELIRQLENLGFDSEGERKPKNAA